MQLTNMKAGKKVNVKLALTAATSALLGLSSVALANEASVLDSWSFDTAVLYYGEIDRVTATEAMIGATKTFEDESMLVWLDIQMLENQP